MLEKQKANVKETWKILNEVINKKNLKKKKILLMDLRTSLQMLAPNLANNIPLPKNDTNIFDYLEENIEHTMCLSPVDDDLEIIRTVQNCKIKDQQKNKYTVGVFIDLKKAFDTVDHDKQSKKTAFLWFAWCRTGMDSELFRK